MRLTDEEVEVLREALDLLLDQSPPGHSGHGYSPARKEFYDRQAIAEDLYSRLRLDRAA